MSLDSYDSEGPHTPETDDSTEVKFKFTDHMNESILTPKLSITDTLIDVLSKLVGDTHVCGCCGLNLLIVGQRTQGHFPAWKHDRSQKKQETRNKNHGMNQLKQFDQKSEKESMEF